MPTVQDCLEHAKFLISKGRGAESAVLVLPKIEAQKRRANKEKRTRVAFDCDPQIYSDFHAQRSRYVEICGNVAVAHALMVRCLAQLSDELIKTLSEDDADSSFVMGKGRELSE